MCQELRPSPVPAATETGGALAGSIASAAENAVSGVGDTLSAVGGFGNAGERQSGIFQSPILQAPQNLCRDYLARLAGAYPSRSSA